MHNKLVVILTILGIGMFGVGCSQPATQSVQEGEGRYEIRQANRDGIGKIYMGREISHVMGYQGAGWLERSTRDEEEATRALIDTLSIESDAIIADIGAGTGYFALPMASRAPDGRVFAVDIQQEMLGIIEQRMQQASITNIELVRGEPQSPKLPADTLDLVLMVDVYHEFSHPYEMGMGIVDALKPGGKVVLIEYRAEDPAVPIKRLHKMSEAQARKEMEAVGLTWVETKNFLPQQHYMVFEKR